ncbi:hypothetical protein ACFU98_05195 [Streptomyces sp. NPDC057575]|uniref:hypothetical protein n=1 Tax=unclassified Streptomyces TaxID=2593676 RepID=UPI0036AEF481
MTDDTLRVQLLALVVESGDGSITEQDVINADGSLRSLNYSSISYMRLIDAIENELGVYVDPEADSELFDNLDTLLVLVRQGMEQADV